MPSATSKTFKSGNSEAVRLPKELGFGVGVELTMVRSGDVLTLYPTRTLSLREMLRELEKLPKPSAIGTRDEIEIPERNGL